MKEVKIICDKCRKDAQNYKYYTSKDVDPSGNGYVYNWIYIDLCLNCFQEFILENRGDFKLYLAQ